LRQTVIASAAKQSKSSSMRFKEILINADAQIWQGFYRNLFAKAVKHHAA
jgi:hypothetical protein